MKNVILSVDALYPPLTGIGKYTSFIAQGLINSTDFGSVKFFDNGLWIDKKDVVHRTTRYSDQLSANAQSSYLARLRQAATQSKVVMALYTRFTPLIFSRRLAKYSNTHVYHSPNFIAPTFSGKKITTFHDLSIIKYPQFHPEARVRFLKGAMQKSIDSSDIIIVDANAIKSEIIDHYGISEDRIRCVPLASTLSEESHPSVANNLFEEYGLLEKRYFLSVATIEPRKNLNTIIDAYAKLDEEIQNLYPLIVTGDIGWKSQEFHASLNHKTRQNILYLGYVSNAQLAELYRHAGLFISASLYEGFGLPCLEAQFFKVPALVSDIPVHREVTGGHAAYFPASDPETLAELMINLIERPEESESLVKAAKDHANRFSWETTVQKILEIYKEI